MSANSAVHGEIKPNFELMRDIIVDFFTCKNEDLIKKMQALEC